MSDRKATVLSMDQPPETSNAKPSRIKKRYVFLVGINNYVDKAFTSLRYCVRDVEALKNTLSRLNYDPTCLNDALDRDDRHFPNRANIKAELTRLCEHVEEDDLLWVHFACHGTRLKEHAGSKEQPVLIAQDTRNDILAETSLSLAEVEKLMQQSKAKRLILTLDACETGVEMGRDLNTPDFIKNANELAEGYVVISASTASQAAQEWKDGKHGIFTYYLLTGLKGGAKQTNRSIITVNDLQGYVVDGLKKWSKEQGGQRQEPTYRAQGMGDIILADLKDIKLGVDLKTCDINYSRIKIEDQGWKGKKIELNPSHGSIEYFAEKLDDLTLEIGKIPRGKFQMGSYEKESERLATEDPQHEVPIESFFISRTLITQAQWRAVAKWVADNKPVNKEIKLELEPSYFKGDELPVEQVSWFEAVEFCDQLSKKTGRQYRLPSEAEWEYACRAATTSPFHYGDTISTDLANYRGTNYKENVKGKDVEYKGFYGEGSQGKYRGQTTEVRQFKPNAFGLYDMHGNLYEWCADYWNQDYKGAPADGSIWTKGGFDTHRVLRGGSWANNPGSCRSASRLGYYPKPKVAIIGFRVVYELL